MSSVRKHFSLEAANFSLFSLEGEVTSSLIPGPAWSLRLQFTKYQQRYAPMKFFKFFFFFFFFFVIPLTVYIRSTELYRSQFLCYIFLLAMGLQCPAWRSSCYRTRSNLSETFAVISKCYAILSMFIVGIGAMKEQESMMMIYRSSYHTDNTIRKSLTCYIQTHNSD